MNSPIQGIHFVNRSGGNVYWIIVLGGVDYKWISK